MKKYQFNVDKVEITEMFMAQADNDRCFYGIIKRGKDESDKPYVFSRINMRDGGLLQAKAPEQKELGKNLDEMCIMYLDKRIHDDRGKSRWFCSEIVTNMVRDIHFTDPDQSNKMIDDLCKFYMN